MARLHLFLVTRKKAHPAELVGEVNQMVVAAPSRGDALRVHPDAGVRYDEVVEAWVRDLGRAPAEIWPPPNGLKCLRIGVAMPNQGPGPVMVDTVSLPLLTPEHHVDGLLHAWFTAISADDEEECACLTHEMERLDVMMDVGEELLDESAEFETTEPVETLVPTRPPAVRLVVSRTLVPAGPMEARPRHAFRTVTSVS